jgi:protein translocase SecG subunit
MLVFLYSLHVIVSVLLILSIIFKKSENTTSLVSSNQYNSFFNNKISVSDPLNKITVILGSLFFILCILISIFTSISYKSSNDILNTLEKINKSKVGSESNTQQLEKNNTESVKKDTNTTENNNNKKKKAPLDR